MGVRKSYRRLKKFLPYRDTRGHVGSMSYRMPRKLKKQWRREIEESLYAYSLTAKWTLRWVPLHGWTVQVFASRKKKRSFALGAVENDRSQCIARAWRRYIACRQLASRYVT